MAGAWPSLLSPEPCSGPGKDSPDWGEEARESHLGDVKNTAQGFPWWFGGLRLHIPNAGGLGLDPCSGNWIPMGHNQDPPSQKKSKQLSKIECGQESIRDSGSFLV